MSSRKNFGQLKEVIQPPNLIENQIQSFNEFLQMDAAPTQRKIGSLSWQNVLVAISKAVAIPDEVTLFPRWLVLATKPLVTLTLNQPAAI